MEGCFVKFKKYFSLILVVSMLFSVLNIQIASASGDSSNCVWIEAENATPDTGVGIGSISGAAGSTYQTLSGLKALRINGGTATGIGINFNFSVDAAQSYDIFVHGTYEVNSAWMSQISMHVDGTARTVTNLGTEGWIIKGSSNYNFQVGWQKVTTELTEGNHTFRWQIDGKGTSASTNKALCDVIVVVPTSAGFVPTPLETVDSLFPVKNSMDYELCTILNGEGLTNLEEDLVLPATTAGGYAVTWTTSDSSVIGADGKIKPSGEVKTATLTATITNSGTNFTKSFPVSLAAVEGNSDTNFAWIEAKDMTRGGGASLGLISATTAGDRVSGSDYLRVNTGGAPADSNGYYADSTFALKDAGNYDIFVRGSWYEYSTDYASAVEFAVDGTTCTDVTVVSDEGWINPNTSGSTTWPMGWQKVTVTLTEGNHTFRWAIKSVNSKENKYKGLLDVVVVVPNGCGFVPTSVSSVSDAFPSKNLSDYQACMDNDGEEEVASTYIWLEETDATYNGFNRNFTVDGFSGGYAYGCNTQTAPGTEGYYLEYEFETVKADVVTIWIHGTQSDHAQASDAKIYIDGTLYEDEKYGADKWAGTTFVYGWRKITASLPKGTHTIKYLIDSTETKTNKHYRGMLDCICVVPSDYVWEEPSISTRPYKSYYFEAENYTTTNWRNSGGSVISENDAMRGGKYVSLYNNPSTATEYYIEYQIQAPATGYYRLDIASTPPQNCGWSSRIYAKVNAGTVFELSADPAKTSESSLTLYHSDAMYLTKGLNTIRFIVKDRIDSNRYVCRIDYFALSAVEVELSGIYADAPYMVFENDENVVPYVQANGFVPEDVTVSYIVTDYYGETVKVGNATIPQGQRRGNINLGKLDNGYYKITATNGEQTVTNDISVVVPLASRGTYTDTPFAIDTNFYSLYNRYSENKDLLSDYVDSLELLGVTWIRDRIPLDDSVATNTDGEVSVAATKNNNIGNIVKSNSNIKISCVADVLPTWIKSSYSEFGTDYNLVYKLFKALGDAVGDNVDCFEILNETDHGGGSGYDDNGADTYAAFAKAAAVGISESNSNALVITQGNARYPDNPGRYSEILYDNQLFDYVSADNYHSHVLLAEDYSEPYTAFTGITGNKIVDNLKKQYKQSVPVWVTEAGYLIENAAGEELNNNEIERQAKYLVTSTVESLSTGVDKHFYFLGNVYDETSSSTGITYTTGIMNKNKKYPAYYPAYSAMSAMTYILGEGQYIGKIADDGVYAYAFQDGDDTVLVLYNDGTATNYDVKLDCNTATKYDMFANEEVLNANGGTFTVSVSSEPVYLKFAGNITSELDESFADELITISDRTLTEADKIIISQEYSSTSKKNARSEGYYINSSNKTVTVTVTNLNPTAKNVTVNSAASNGWSVSPASQTVSVGANGTATLTFTVNVNEKSYDSKISFVGTVDGAQTSVSSAYAYGGFAEVEFVNDDGMILYEFNEEANNYARINLNNKNSFSSKDVEVYIAAYDETEKLLYKISKNDLKVNILSTTSTDIKIRHVEKAAVYKVFIWDPSMSPYARTYKLPADFN